MPEKETDDLVMPCILFELQDLLRNICEHLGKELKTPLAFSKMSNAT